MVFRIGRCVFYRTEPTQLSHCAGRMNLSTARTQDIYLTSRLSHGIGFLKHPAIASAGALFSVLFLEATICAKLAHRPTLFHLAYTVDSTNTFGTWAPFAHLNGSSQKTHPRQTGPTKESHNYRHIAMRRLKPSRAPIHLWGPLKLS